MSAGKVEIGCFRTFSDNHVKKVEDQMKSGSGSGGGAKSVPLDKIAELGAHYHKYYQLDNSFYKS